MKKIICFILTAALILTSTSVAYAKTNNAKKQNQNKHTYQQSIKNEKEDSSEDQEDKYEVAEVSQLAAKKTEAQQTSTKAVTKQQNKKIKETKQEFKIDGSPVIKYGKYKLPIRPVTKGMGAAVTFDKATAILTVTKGTTTIIINFKDMTVTVNGVADTESGIFTASNSKKMTVLVKYIANALGVRVNSDDDKIIVKVPGLDFPTNVTVTPVGDGSTAVKANTLNSTSLYLTASASIVAGQAVGGKAELYVGSTLVAVDAEIAKEDTSVTFTTSDGTPVNAELQAAVPAGGVVTVKLYNADNKSVVSVNGNPTLAVDYVAPVVNSVSSAAYSVSGSAITVNFAGTAAIGDIVDVSKIFISDPVLGLTYQLTNAPGTGSTGIVNGVDTMIITLGSADQLGIAGFTSTSLLFNLNAGSLVFDAAGNTSAATTAVQTLPLTVNP